MAEPPTPRTLYLVSRRLFLATQPTTVSFQPSVPESGTLRARSIYEGRVEQGSIDRVWRPEAAPL